MATVGDVDFVWLNGVLPAPAQRLNKVTRPGVDGVAVRLEGEEAEHAVLPAARDYDSDGDAEDTLTLLASYVGTQQSVVTSTGTAHDDVLVWGVRETSRKRVGAMVGGLSALGRWLCTYEFDLQRTE